MLQDSLRDVVDIGRAALGSTQKFQNRRPSREKRETTKDDPVGIRLIGDYLRLMFGEAILQNEEHLEELKGMYVELFSDTNNI